MHSNANATRDFGDAPKLSLDRLLDTAAVQFAQFGLDGISIRTIGREAGLKAPSICYHFNSKDNLYLEAFAHKIEQTIDFVSARLVGVADRKHRFPVLIEVFFELFTSDRSLLLLMQRDVIDASLNNRPFLSEQQYVYFTSLIRQLGSEHVGYQIDQQTAFVIASMIFGYCELSFVRSGMHGRSAADAHCRCDAAQAGKAALVRAALTLVQAGTPQRPRSAA